MGCLILMSKKILITIILILTSFVAISYLNNLKSRESVAGEVIIEIHYPNTIEKRYFSIEENQSLLEILLDNYYIEYETFSFGIFITRIEDLKQNGNSYIMIYLNGNISLVGVSDLILTNEDIIYFKLEN